jgi:UPF0042 nucleotide-binding protein
VDNLPPSLIAAMVDLGSHTSGEVTRIAVVVDVRSRAFSADLRSVIGELDEQGYRPRVLFLEAADDVLVPPVREQPAGPPAAGRRPAGRRDRGRAGAAVRPARGGRPGRRHQPAVRARPAPAARARVQRGGAAGAAGDGALVRLQVRAAAGRRPRRDVRFLPNPHWIPELRRTPAGPGRTGLRAVAGGAGRFLDVYTELLRLVGAGYQREGKRYLTLAIGCTGGKHRSVAMAEEIAKRLAGDGVQTTVAHRDIGRE